MFRTMRRKRQLLGEDEALDMIRRGSHGVLAVVDETGYPYAVPISPVVYDGRVYFHCAKSGHKLDAIRACDRVSLCVVDRDDVQPATFSTHYRSAILFGRARIVEDAAEILGAMRALAAKYSPNEGEAAFQHEMSTEAPALCVVAIEIEHLSGKQAKGLVKSEQQEENT